MIIFNLIKFTTSLKFKIINSLNFYLTLELFFLAKYFPPFTLKNFY